MLVVLLAGIANGQDAQLSGLIQDPSEAAVPGAEITLRSDQTGGRRVARSSEAGLYSLTTLKPGVYRMTVRAAGFETIVRENIELQVGENARLDFTLHMGDSRTTVTVTGGAPLINQDDASVGTVIDRNLIDRMPLNGRGIQTLIELTPGVLPVPVIQTSRGQFVINGQRSDANYFTVDGISANFAAGDILTQNVLAPFIKTLPTLGQAGGGVLPASNFLGTFSNLVSPDDLQEFRIQTSTYAPEFGSLPGGQINLISRSGGSRFSGSLFEYLRNDKADANDWFSNAAGLPRAPLRFNNFGGTFAGPVRVPHLLNGDGHTFFFLSLDSLIAREPQAAVVTGVPSITARQNAPPALAALLDAYPLPTSGEPAPSAILLSHGPLAGYSAAGTVGYDQQARSIRVDHNFGQSLLLFVRYSHAPANRTGSVQDGLPSNLQHYDLGTDTVTFGLTHVIAANLVNDFRANFSQQSIRDSFDIKGSGARMPPAAELFPPGYSSSDSISDFELGGAPAILIGTHQRDRTHQSETVDNLSWTRAAHRFRFGIDYRRFLSGQTISKLVYAINANIYNADGSFASNSTEATSAIYFDNDVEYLIPQFSAYAEDTWRVSRRLTLTGGLRWEVEPAPRSTRGQPLVVGGLTNLNDASNTYVLAPGQPFYPTTWTNLAPRVGLGWQLFENGGHPTVLRVGAGGFFDSAQSGFEDNVLNRVVSATYTAAPLGSVSLQNPATTMPNQGYTAVGAPRGYNLPTTYEWNVTLEHPFGKQTVSAGYVGSIARGLIGDIAYLPTTSSVLVHVIGNNASSSYNSMQLQLNRRFSGRLQMLISYTWSHSIDNLSNDLSPIEVTRTLAEYQHVKANRGDSDFDVRQSLNGAVIVDLPSPRGRGFAAALLRNWRANSIFFARGAFPLSVISIESNLPGTDYVEHVPGEPYYLYGSQYPGGKRLNPNAFKDVFGAGTNTLGRNSLRGFPAWQIDFALHRDFHLAENISLQLRIEMFNILNHPNFADPVSSGYSNSVLAIPVPSFGTATSMLANGLSPSQIPGELNPLFQIGGPRIMQFALRLSF
jgi:hypothetical protein